LYRRLGGLQGRSGHIRKNLAPTGQKTIKMDENYFEIKKMEAKETKGN
jgi:hypothetical protein